MDAEIQQLQAENFAQAPTMRAQQPADIPTPKAAEKLLEEWFEAPVVLLSAGRTGFHLLLNHMGFHPNRTSVTVPQFTARCVLSTLMLDAFPTLSAGGDVVIHYPQYGFRQSVAPREKIVVEDIAHAFFSKLSSGARKWKGVAAVFSLPKFFSTAGLVGGLIVPDTKLAEELRAERDSMPDADAAILTQRRESVIESYKDLSNAKNFAMLEGAYALYPVFPRADPESLLGIPASLEAISAVGEARLARMNLLSRRLGDPHELLSHAEGGLPFLFPSFVKPENFQRQVAAINEMGIAATVYHFDVARNAYDPQFMHALMMPCHHQIPLELLDKACDFILS